VTRGCNPCGNQVKLLRLSRAHLVPHYSVCNKASRFNTADRRFCSAANTGSWSRVESPPTASKAAASSTQCGTTASVNMHAVLCLHQGDRACQRHKLHTLVSQQRMFAHSTAWRDTCNAHARHSMPHFHLLPVLKETKHCTTH
jgi:hypothetical protein